MTARVRYVFGRGRAVQIVGGNAVAVLHDGAECFPAMLSAIAAAQREILLEMYWFGSDETGFRFATLLAERARAGLDVYVVYDAVGSFDSDESVFDLMRRAGVHVHQFHPVAPWRRRFRVGRINNRNHRKLLVVDGRVVFTGGVNIGDEWASVEDGGGGWRDDMIRIEGPAAREARAIFNATWNDLRREQIGELDPTPEGDSEHGPPQSSRVQIVANHYRVQRRAILEAYLAQIDGARHAVDISNSYFVPDRHVRKALVGAAKRGVRVRVLLPGESDVLAVRLAGERLYGALMACGIELYRFQGPILHAKSAVIDDHWCTVGTFNLDYRSFRSNLEVNAIVEDERVAKEVRRKFEEDLTCSQRIDPHDWAFRPLGQRALEMFFYMFRKLL